MPKKIIFTEEEKRAIINYRLEGNSFTNTANKFNCSKEVIRKLLVSEGVDVTPIVANRKDFNDKFFYTLTKESAYFLGLFVADGSVGKSRNTLYFSISLNKEDSYILSKLLLLLGSNHKLTSDRGLCKISIGSSLLALSVAQYGINVIDKTYAVGRCETLFALLREFNVLSHFVRGFLDGDGSIYVNKYNSSISFTGHIDFISTLRSEINAAIGYSKGGISLDNREGKYSSRMRGKIGALSYTGRNIVKKVGDWIYEDCGDLFLTRKYEKFQDVIKLRESGKA